MKILDQTRVYGMGFMANALKTNVWCISCRKNLVISILQGLEMGWKGLATGSRGLKIMKEGDEIIKKGFDPKVKSPKMGLPSSLVSFRSGPPFFAIFSGAKYIWKEKDRNKYENWGFSPFGAGYPSI